MFIVFNFQANSVIKTLIWDGNDTTPAGFKKFCVGMKMNTTLIKMPFPYYDVS